MSKPAALDPAVLEYIAEGKEIIERVSKNLSLIENGNSDSEIIASLYRDVHTLKGSSQLFGYKLTAQVSHALEACLDPIRKGKMNLGSMVTQACVKNIDLLDRLIQSIEVTGKEFDNEEEITKWISLLVEASTLENKSAVSVTKDDLRVEIAEVAPLRQEAKKEESPKVVELPVSQQQSSVAMGSSAPLPAQVQSAAPQTEATIRVQVNLLDRILNLVGELVLVRNQLVQYRNRIDDADFLTTSKSLDVVTSDLQGEIMKTRMQPIETVIGKFQRVVRDIARDLGKKIDLTLEGSETELDKSLLEAIKDPLTHIVRNSCDHGIEFPDDRRKANKPETGHVLIRSFHEGGQVVIEISDDGRGINRQRVVQKAIEKGILSPDKASKLSDREICDLIFYPGFSTASEVTNVSGRGVGMDVVKTNIEKIGGSVETKSVEGKGTSIQLRIPLTLAIVPALIVKSHKEKFAIPQVKLLELVRVDARDHNAARIESLQGRPMFRLRGALLPLYDLRDITGEQYDPNYGEGVFIIVLSTDGETFGLLVPEVLDTADIVVKPMSSLLNNLSAFSGATILGDGSIALILDVGGVAEHGKVLNRRVQREDRETFSKLEREKQFSDIQEFLVFSLGSNAIHGIPLCLVNRLEEFSRDSIEKSGDQLLVKYRGNLLPLVNLSRFLKYPNQDTSSSVDLPEKISVIVIQRSGRSYGFIVNEIIDVATIDGHIDDSIRDRNGILGNLIHNEDVVVVIDALGIIEDFNFQLKGQDADHKNKSLSQRNSRDALGELRNLNKEMKFKSIRVLYAEDVAFFRKHVSKVLAGVGVDVTTVEDGLKAIQELDSCEADRYNLILSDIEMPHMNGLELAKEVRKREKFRNVPMIALTTRFRETDIQEGKLAGFNVYLEKLNPDKLMDAIQELMKDELKDRPLREVER